MEGNLTRARGSLYPSTPSISSLGSDGSTPSPPVQRASTAIYARETDPNSPTFSQARTPLSSDGISPTTISFRGSVPRSASALGVSGGYRQPLTASRSVDHLGNSEGHHGQPGYRISWHPRDRALEPLSEDEVASAGEPSSFSKGANVDQFLSPTFGSFSDSANGNDRGLQRSASVAQMRDLKDQVKGLKGKISSLREQARADSLKRRSLQSLRTPSPFTHAQVDQWYAEPEPPASSEAGSTNADSARNPWNGELSSVDGEGQVPQGAQEKYVEDEDSIYSEVDTNTSLRPPGNQSPEGKVLATTTGPDVVAAGEDGSDGSDLQTENGDSGAEGQDDDDVGQVDDEAAYDSESGESLYHDTVQHPISHEDREDAFDYEHFFLHSAMGTLSQQKLARRGSRSSFSSEDSVETTRGPAAESDAKKSSGDEEVDGLPTTRAWQRRNSDASVSTVGTFATANEGGAESGREREDPTSGQFATAAAKERSGSPETARKASFAPGSIDAGFNFPASRRSTGSITSIPEEGKEGHGHGGPNASFGNSHGMSAFRRPMSSSAANSLHRPSVSSFESTGTNRSFPLVNRPKKANSVGILTPHNSSSLDQEELKALSDSLMSETASICEQQQERDADDDGSTRLHRPNGSMSSVNGGMAGNPNAPQAMQTLVRDDQLLVERLVAGLGRCVLGLAESGRASTESRMYRRRIDAARRILEGLEDEV